jgi:hypothetical protein
MPTTKAVKKPTTKSAKTVIQADIDFDDDSGRKDKLREISRQ